MDPRKNGQAKNGKLNISLKIREEGENERQNMRKIFTTYD